MLWKLKSGPKNCGRCRQVVVIRRLLLTHVWLYTIKCVFTKWTYSKSFPIWCYMSQLGIKNKLRFKIFLQSDFHFKIISIRTICSHFTRLFRLPLIWGFWSTFVFTRAQRKLNWVSFFYKLSGVLGIWTCITWFGFSCQRVFYKKLVKKDSKVIQKQSCSSYSYNSIRKSLTQSIFVRETWGWFHQHVYLQIPKAQKTIKPLVSFSAFNWDLRT